MLIASRSSRSLALTATLLTTVVVVKVLRPSVVRHVRRILSKTLEGTMVKSSIAVEEALREFRDQTILSPNVRSHHTHPRCAAMRSVAVAFIRQFALTLGAPEYAYGQSRRDQSLHVKGQRLYFWGKDVDKKVTCDTIGGLVSMVDVDYHLSDLESLLAGRDYPVVISTINPTKVAKSSGEVTYFFNRRNQIVMRYSGGARFDHELWDYTPDTLSASRRLFGVPFMTTQFKVEKRQLDDLRTIVCLVPLGTWRGLWAVLYQVLQQNSLKRLRPVHRGWAHLIITTAEGLTHSLGECETYGEATLTATEFDDSVQAAKQSKHSPTVSMLASWLGQDRGRALTVAAYCKAELPFKPAYVTSVKDSVSHISSSVKTFGDDGEEPTTVEGFMAPLITGACFAHTNTRDNAKWGVKARITGLAKTTGKLTAFPLQCIKEFISLVAESGPLVPATYDEVFAAQDRPTQRALLEEGAVSGAGTDPLIRSFLKKESVQGCKDPRVISTIEPRSKLEYSRYMRAYGKHLKNFEWYGFSTPETISTRVADMMCDKAYALEGDFSRMDGNVDENVRLVFEVSLLRALFPGCDDVIALHKEQFGQRGNIRGHGYDVGFSRTSGSPETSPFNSTLTAFIVFYKNRLLGLTSAEAFECIGIVGGDDSLVPGVRDVDPQVDAKAFERAARGLGQVLTSEIRLRGEPVVFLSRVFGAAWECDPTSMASPLRVIAKIHCSPNMVSGVTPQDKCHEKGFALFCTDSQTPILGRLAKKMMTVGKRIDAKYQDRASNWWLQFQDNSWPNEAAPWMDEVITAQLAEFDLDKFNAWVDGGDTMAAPTCLDVPVQPGKIDTIIGDQLVAGANSGEDSSSQCLQGFGVESDVKVPLPKSTKTRRSKTRRTGKPKSVGAASSPGRDKKRSSNLAPKTK